MSCHERDWIAEQLRISARQKRQGVVQRTRPDEAAPTRRQNRELRASPRDPEPPS
jgi:hypothetical protein